MSDDVLDDTDLSQRRTLLGHRLLENVLFL